RGRNVRRPVRPGGLLIRGPVEVQITVLEPVVLTPVDWRMFGCRDSVERHLPVALRHAVAVGVLAQLAAGEVVTRAGDRPGRPFGFRAGTDAGVGVAGALALLGSCAFAAAEAGVEHVRVVNAELVDRLAVGQLRADLSVPDLLLHEHAALQRGPG